MCGLDTVIDCYGSLVSRAGRFQRLVAAAEAVINKKKRPVKKTNQGNEAVKSVRSRNKIYGIVEEIKGTKKEGSSIARRGLVVKAGGKGRASGRIGGREAKDDSLDLSPSRLFDHGSRAGSGSFM